jgi:hypothetical protein
MERAVKGGAGIVLRRVLAGVIAVVSLLGCATSASASVSFQPVPGSPFSIQVNPARNPYAEAFTVGDFNGDGRIDVVSANTHPNECLSVLLGKGAGALELAHVYDGYATPQLCDSTTGHQAVASADLNGDGKLDLVDASRSGVVVDTGNGDGSFTLKGSTGAPESTEGVVLADLNGDGKLDLVEAGHGQNASWESIEFVNAELGNGDATFQAPVGQTVDKGYQTPAIGVADFTGDGIPDAIVATSGERPATGKLLLLAGKGDGTFAAPVQIAANGGTTLAVADFNGDNHPDVAVGEKTEWSVASPAVRIYLGDGNGGFSEANSPLVLAVEQSGAAVAASDVDGDGKVDLVVALPGEEPSSGERIKTVSVLPGNGDGSFQAARAFDAGVEAERVAVADLTGDAHPELIVGGQVVSETEFHGLVAVLGNVAAAPPHAATAAATAIATDAAVLTGTVNPQGESTSYRFEYGPTSSYGSSTPEQTVGADSSDHVVSAPISGLAPYTTYHFRIVASSGAGTVYGEDLTFTTAALKAEAQTGPPSGVTRTGATLTGTVNPNGAPLAYHFDYGTTTSYGSSTTEQSAGSGSGQAGASTTIGGLSAGTVYHYRIVAHGPAGTIIGGDRAFYTPVSEPQPAESYTTFQKSLRLSSDTVLQRYLDVMLTCTDDCYATVDRLSLELIPASSTRRLEGLQSVGSSVEVKATARLAAGHAGKLHVPLAPEVEGWIADVLRHGGQVRLTPSFTVIDPHGASYDALDVQLHEPGAGKVPGAKAPHRGHAASAVNEAYVAVKEAGAREHPRPHRWQIALSGRQTTTWHYNADKAEEGCEVIAHGSGSQTIEFTGTETVSGYIWMSNLGVPLLTTLDGRVPFDVPLELTINRQGSVTSGIAKFTSKCAVATGGDGHSATPDCGERHASAVGELGWLGVKDLHASEDTDTGLLGDGGLYQDCPFSGSGLGDLYLHPADDESFPADLVLTKTAHRKISEFLHGSYHESLYGGTGYADTEVIWNVTMLRVDCPTGAGPGGLRAVCIDDKQKEEAAKEASEYKKAEEYAANGIKATCKATSVDNVKETGGACLVMAIKDGYDSHMQGKDEAIADDPPDPRFRRVIRAHVASLKLPSSTPGPVRKLLADEQRATALSGVLATTINRANSALAAGDASALRRQDRAALADARRLAKLFGAQPKLMKRARRALLAVVPASQRALADLLDTPADVKTARSMAALMKSFARQRL